MRAAAAILGCLAAQPPAPRTPAVNPLVVGTDVARFYRALDVAGPDASVPRLTTALNEEYFAAGSPGLRHILAARISSAEALARVVAEHRDYYDAVRTDLLAMASDPAVREQVNAAFERLSQWLPDARFPTTYLLVGRLNTAGTTRSSAVLIGLDMFGRAPERPLDTLDRWTRMSLRTPDELVLTIVHEAIHTLQRGGPPRTLLEAAIHEGVCDFLATEATGLRRNTPAYAYARANEATLWAEFSSQMHHADWGDWLYTTPRNTSRPPDLGYAIGAKICHAYWHRTPDKRAAARTLLRSRNAADILAASGYPPQPPDATSPSSH